MEHYLCLLLPFNERNPWIIFVCAPVSDVSGESTTRRGSLWRCAPHQAHVCPSSDRRSLFVRPFLRLRRMLGSAVPGMIPGTGMIGKLSMLLGANRCVDFYRYMDQTA